MRTLFVAVLGAALLLPAAAREPAGTRDRLRADVEFLASPPLEGRASASRGAEAAAWFIASEMRKAGLREADSRTYLQRFDVVPIRLDRERSAVRVARDGTERSFVPDAVLFPDPTREVDLDLDVVFAGYGITAPEFGYDDYAALDVSGKAVLVFDHEPQEDDPRSVFLGTGFTLHANAWVKTRNAQAHGASAVLIVTEPINTHRVAPRPPDRANAPPQGLAHGELTIPRVSLPAAAAAAVLEGSGRSPAEWQRAIDRMPHPDSRPLAGVRVKIHAVNAESGVRPSWSVAGVVPGTGSLAGETLVVVAHYDHLGVQNGKLYAGANDNASGVAVMLEVARQLGRTSAGRTILFLAAASEEQLMLGSFNYIAHPLRPLATTRAVLCLDMVGRSEADTPESQGAYAVTAARSDQLNLVGAVFSPDLTRVLERQAGAAKLHLSDKFDRDSSSRALFRCDHLPFLQRGIPAIWLFGGFHPGYHEPADTIDALDFDKMERVVRLTAGSLRALAAGDAPRFRHSPGHPAETS